MGDTNPGQRPPPAGAEKGAEKSIWPLMGLQLVVWGSYATVAKFALTGLDVWQFQSLSFGVATLAMAIVFFAGGGARKLKATPPKTLLKLAGAGVVSFLYYLLYAIALRLTTAVEAAILNYTFPVFILLLAWPVNRERLTVKGVLAVLVGFAGTVVVVAGSSPGQAPTRLAGVLCALGAAVCWGLFTNLGKRLKTDVNLNNMVYIFTGFILAALGLLVFSRPVVPPLGAGLGAVANGLLSFVVGYSLWFRIVRRVPMALAASMSFVTPFVTLLFISLFLGERIALRQWLGLAVILCGLLLQNLRPQRRP